MRTERTFWVRTDGLQIYTGAGKLFCVTFSKNYYPNPILILTVRNINISGFLVRNLSSPNDTLIFIPVTRRVKGYSRFVGKYVTGRRTP